MAAPGASVKDVTERDPRALQRALDARPQAPTPPPPRQEIDDHEALVGHELSIAEIG
jgi:hypothetical protein